MKTRRAFNYEFRTAFLGCLFAFLGNNLGAQEAGPISWVSTVPPYQQSEPYSTVTIKLEANDTDGKELVYGYETFGMLPLEGADLNSSTGQFTWSPVASQTNSRHEISFIAYRAEDPSVLIRMPVSFDIFSVSVPGDWETIPSAYETPVGRAVEFTLPELIPAYSWGNGAPPAGLTLLPITYSVVDLPPGASFDEATRIFRFVPLDWQTDISYSVNFRASDGYGESNQFTVISVVAPTPTAARILEFGARRVKADEVRVTWTSGVEYDHLGYRLQRNTNNQGWVDFAGMIPARGSSTFYSSFDRVDESDEVTYKLIGVDLRGKWVELALATLTEGSRAQITLDGDRVQIKITGKPSSDVALEASPSVAGPWSMIKSVNLDQQGTATLIFPGSDGRQFYRVR